MFLLTHSNLVLIEKINDRAENNKMDRFFKKIKIVNFIVMATIFSILISITGCREGAMNLEAIKFNTVESISEDNWQRLYEKKIFFGHQSLGNNIIEGIHTIKKEYPFVKLNIVKGRDNDTFAQGVFAHDKVGKNHDPKSKIDDFYSIINTNMNIQIDVAFLKFCFVDIDATSDVNAIFKYYRTRMKLLKKKFPEILFVHFTVPLIREEKKSRFSYIKTIIKKIIGKESTGFFDDDNNVARNRFNSLLVSEYKGQEPFFDIAKIESTKLDGQRSFFKKDREIFYSLVSDYTGDAGHLNKIGQKIVAEQLICFLASLPRQK